ncbi:MAG: iron chelate uptake ABC transporter family permease subunit, partial [Brevundimonas sp.]|nr:iron chelate uptake ABC transporter family permease subunit [Brevundimonas sp.]
MTVARINLMLALALAVALIAALTLGEVGLSGAQYLQAFRDPASGPGLILWQVRAPRAVCAVAVGAALGLSGALMQG